MDINIASQGFAAVGSQPRLSVLALLVRAGPAGLSTSDIQKKLFIPLSTLSHHLNALFEGGVIKQTKNGRTMISVANFDHLTALAEFLLDECCKDSEKQPELAPSHG